MNKVKAHIVTDIICQLSGNNFCTKWVNLRGGDDLVQQGEQSQGKLYIVLFGTLLCLVNKDSTPSSENSAGLERGAEMEVEEGEGTSSEEDVNGDRGGEGSSQRNRRSHARRDDEASSGYSQIGHTASKGYTFGRGTLIGECRQGCRLNISSCCIIVHACSRALVFMYSIVASVTFGCDWHSSLF